MAASPTEPFYDRERAPRRPAPDWGGDDLFDAIPRRRFARAPLQEPTGSPGDAGDPDGAPVIRPESVLASGVESHPGLSSSGGDIDSRPVEVPSARRTVVITGQPGRSSSVERHRPSRLEQRIHARPDRLAAWAFALCVFLIIVALATSL